MDLRLVGLNLRQAGRPTHTWRCSASRYASESPNPGRRTTAPTHRHNGQTPSSRVPIGTVVKRVRSVFVGCEPSSVRSIVAGCVASFNLGPYLCPRTCVPLNLSPDQQTCLRPNLSPYLSLRTTGRTRPPPNTMHGQMCAAAERSLWQTPRHNGQTRAIGPRRM